MSLSTRRPPGIPSSVRPPRSASTTRGEVSASRSRDDSPLPSRSTDNKYRAPQSGRSRSVPRQEEDNPFRSRRREQVPPVPSIMSRHSAQSSVSSSSSGSSAVSAASTAASSLWDYVGRKTNVEGSASEHEERIPSPEPAESRPVQADSNATFWTRVAVVAGGLGVNVAKAWEAKDDLPEPDTPPGCDSRVTTALKKHYIKQVSDPRQLPAWLFSDIERQAGRSYARTRPTPASNQEEDSYSSSTRTAHAFAPHSRARHDDAYMRPNSGREPTRTVTREEGSAGPTRAATRLRALRDAKRGPVAREVYTPSAPELEPRPVEVVPPPRPRVGLPNRPARAI